MLQDMWKMHDEAELAKIMRNIEASKRLGKPAKLSPMAKPMSDVEKAIEEEQGRRREGLIARAMKVVEDSPGLAEEYERRANDNRFRERGMSNILNVSAFIQREQQVRSKIAHTEQELSGRAIRIEMLALKQKQQGLQRQWISVVFLICRNISLHDAMLNRKELNDSACVIQEVFRNKCSNAVKEYHSRVSEFFLTNLITLRVKVRMWQKCHSANLARRFFGDFEGMLNSASLRTYISMSKFMRRVQIAQNFFRSYAEIQRARMRVLGILWLKLAKEFGTSKQSETGPVAELAPLKKRLDKKVSTLLRNKGLAPINADSWALSDAPPASVQTMLRQLLATLRLEHVRTLTQRKQQEKEKAKPAGKEVSLEMMKQIMQGEVSVSVVVGDSEAKRQLEEQEAWEKLNQPTFLVYTKIQDVTSAANSILMQSARIVNQEKKVATKTVRRLSTIVMGAIEDGGWTGPPRTANQASGRTSPNGGNSPSKRVGTHLAVEFGESLTEADARDAASVAAATKNATKAAAKVGGGKRKSSNKTQNQRGATHQGTGTA
jgi:hypothetical protein